MIEYKHTAEKQILLHYANSIRDADVISILENGEIKNSVQAHQLASFFWKMVDLTVDDADQGKAIAGQTNLESWCEDILQTLRYHYIETGYMQIWEEESDKAD